MAGRESNFEKVERTLDLAVKYFNKKTDVLELPEDLLNTFERWGSAWQIIKKYNSSGKDYVNSVYAIWLKNVHGISDMRIVREDIYAAPIFGKITDPHNRELERYLAIERLKKKITLLERLGEDTSKYEAILFKYIDPKHDPVMEIDMSEIQNNFNIIQDSNPKTLGIEPVPNSKIFALRNQMLKKANVLKNSWEEATEVKDDKELENGSTI